MDYDENLVDEATLALLFLVSHSDGVSLRAWKGFDWDTLQRLHTANLISDPATKAKSVVFTEEGAKRSEKSFRKLFAK